MPVAQSSTRQQHPMRMVRRRGHGCLPRAQHATYGLVDAQTLAADVEAADLVPIRADR